MVIIQKLRFPIGVYTRHFPMGWIQWSRTLCIIESQWHISYPVWKCLTYRTAQSLYYLFSSAAIFSPAIFSCSSCKIELASPLFLSYIARLHFTDTIKRCKSRWQYDRVMVSRFWSMLMHMRAANLLLNDEAILLSAFYEGSIHNFRMAVINHYKGVYH